MYVNWYKVYCLGVAGQLQVQIICYNYMKHSSTQQVR